MYSARMVARRAEAVSCGSPAGIHRALVGGRTQVADGQHREHPLAAQASWWSAWVCQSKGCPRASGSPPRRRRSAPVFAAFRRLSGWRHNMAAYALSAAARGPSVGRVNENHAKLMPSPEWAAHIQDEVLPLATEGVELGATCSSSGRAGRGHRVAAAPGPPPGRGRARRGGRRPAGGPVRRHQRRGRPRRRGRARLTRTRPSTPSRPSRCCTTCPPARCRTGCWPRRSGCCGRAVVPRLGQPAQRRPAPVPRGRHLQPGRAGRVPDPAADRASPRSPCASSTTWSSRRARRPFRDLGREVLREARP